MSDISQEELMHIATGIYPELGKEFNSPFRKHENPPGNCRFEWRSGYLRFIDWADRSWHNLNWADILIKRGLASDFKEACDYIEKRVGKVKFEKKDTKVEDNFRSNITFIKRDFKQEDRDHWNRWNIPLAELFRDYTQAVESFTFNSKNHPQIFTTVIPEDLCYAFTFPTGRVKLYRPYAEKKDKWKSNCTRNDVFLENYRQNKRVNIIQGHYKDGKIIQQFRFDTKGLQSENAIPDDYLLERWNDDYETNYILMDADEAGLKATIRMCKHCWERDLDFKPLYWPKSIRESNITDLAELLEEYKGKTYNLFTKLIKLNLNMDRKITHKLCQKLNIT